MTVRHQKTVKTLLEAMPYIRRFWGATVVLKYGGAAMTIDSGDKLGGGPGTTSDEAQHLVEDLEAEQFGTCKAPPPNNGD